LIDPNFDHIGIVVPELEPAVDQMTKLFKFEWHEPHFDGALPMNQPGKGTRDVHLRIANSTQNPRFELIEALPDSPWALEGNEAMLHHVAFFADDLDAMSGHLIGNSCPIEICGVDDDGALPSLFTYHTGGGLRFELLEAAKFLGDVKLPRPQGSGPG
jgi:hypothetical protein